MVEIDEKYIIRNPRVPWLVSLRHDLKEWCKKNAGRYHLSSIPNYDFDDNGEQSRVGDIWSINFKNPDKEALFIMFWK